MASLKTKFSVGLFLIIGIVVVIVGVIWLGLSHYFEEGRFLAAYFDESVQGLDKDSPVKYRGVHIGRVHEIGVAPDGRLIEVVLLIESDFQARQKSPDVVAKLKSVGITGLMFVELEQLGGRPPDVAAPFEFTPPYPVLPTRTSEIAKLFKGIEEVIELFRSLDTEAITAQLTRVLQTINTTFEQARIEALVSEIHDSVKKFNQMVEPAPFAQMLASIDEAGSSVEKMADNAHGGIDEIRRTVNGLDSVIATSGEDIRQITADLSTTAEQIKLAMQTATGLLSHTDRQLVTVQQQIIVTLRRIERATDTMNRFLELIASHPSQLVFGKPQPEKPSLP
jgi:phospholipid/cholesterol/gamma-HCH transport system substrate-binding protein